MSPKSFILQSLFVLLFCTSFLSAMEAHRDPFREHRHLKHQAYVGSLDYHGIPITRELLVLEAKRVREYLPQRAPGMVSALSTGDGKIYFATSTRDLTRGKNKQTDLGLPQMLTEALESCTQDQADSAHNFGGKCAELKAIAEWYHQNGGGKLPESGKLIVAVNYNHEVTAPCSGTGENKFGCADVLPKLGFKADEIVTTDPGSESCQIMRRSSGGLTVRGCVPKKPTAKHSPPGKPAPKKPTAQAPRQGKPKPPSNNINRPKSTPPKMPAKPQTRGPRKLRARSNKGPKH